MAIAYHLPVQNRTEGIGQFVFDDTEILHRWAADVPFPHADGFGPHWNFYLDTSVPAAQFEGPPRAFALEGNVLQDLGPAAECAGRNRFETHPDELADGYSALDQYLMGVRQAGEVGPLVRAENPSPFVNASFGIPCLSTGLRPSRIVPNHGG